MILQRVTSIMLKTVGLLIIVSAFGVMVLAFLPTSLEPPRPTQPTARMIYVTYGQNCCTQSKKRACEQALKHGFTECHALDRSALDPDFQRLNAHILDQPRGAGYWAWKSYIIWQQFESMGPEDVLMYGDAGSYVKQSAQPLIDLVRQDPNGILLFGLCTHLQRAWTKRDVFILTNTDKPEFLEKNQILASYLVLRKTDFARILLQRWLALSQDERAITDAPNQLGQDLPGFKEHRHDQSILSTVAYGMGMRPYRDPSFYGNCGDSQYPAGMLESPFGEIIMHDRHKT